MRLLQIAAGATALLGAAFVQADVPQLPAPTSCPGVTASQYQHSIAAGWSYTKVAGSLRGVRTIVFDTLGNMLVSQAGAGISVHTFGADGCVNSTKMLISNVQLNHGLALTPDGKTLYASSERQAWSWTYDAATLAVTGQKVAITGMDSGIHSTRNLLVVPQKPNLVLLQVGSNANIDAQSAQKATGRAIIKIFDMDKAPATGYNYKADGEVFGYGLRNEIGFTADPAGHVWGVENSGDDIRIGGRDVHIDNPGEKLNYLGDPVTERDVWYGYPTCMSVWDPTPFQGMGTGVHFALQGANTACADARPPRLSFQAHSAPIWNTFDKDAKNMYVTFHGSWDRQPPTGFKVVQIPFTKLENGTYDPVAPADSRTGYTDIFSAANPGSCTANGLTMSNCFRLTAATWDPAGRGLFVGSDNSREGEIYLLSKSAA